MRGEQESEGADVGVLVMADASGCGGGLVVLGVAEKAERGEGGAGVGVVELEARGAGVAQLGGEAREDHEGDGVSVLDERKEAV